MTNRQDELEALAVRCEQAAGPSYTLDCEIWDAVYPGDRDERFAKLTSDGPYKGRLSPHDRDGYIKPLRAFTASIDAALTLVPEGQSVRMGWCAGAGYAEVFEPGTYGDRGLGTGTISAKTPALALCAAALRAKGRG